MLKLAPFLLFASTLVHIELAAPSLQAQTTNPGFLNVKSFGAKGDGLTDDTQAILDTIAAARTTSFSQPTQKTAYIASNTTIFFPSGKYLLSQPLPASVNFLGEGGAILYQPDPEKDIISETGAWRWNARGISFQGGKSQLHIGNPNLDSGRLLIEDCAFYESADAAIRLRKGSNSSQVHINDCTFLACEQTLVNHCDMTVLSNSWITTSRTMQNKAVIENHGILLMENSVGAPAVNPDADQRWIDNYEGVTCRNVRFGGEDGGMTIVVNFAPYISTYPVIPKFVILDSCYIYATGNSKRRCAVDCEEIPNQIVIRSCNGFIDLPAVRINEKLDLPKYLERAKSRPNSLRFSIEADQVELPLSARQLPEPLTPYLASSHR